MGAVNNSGVNGWSVNIPDVGRKDNVARALLSVSRAEEPVSDVEMVSMASATAPSDNSTSMTGTGSRSANLSKSEILREAIVET